MTPDQSEIPAGWDDWLAAQGTRAGFCQSATWARIHNAVNDARSFVLTSEEEGERKAGMLVSLRPYDLPIASPWSRLRAFVTGRLNGTLECFEGPVLSTPTGMTHLRVLLRKLDALSSRLGVRMIRLGGVPPLAGWGDNPEASALFFEFGYRKISWLTSIVDLAPTEEALQRSFRQSARKGIRKALEGGLSVSQCKTEDDFVRDFRSEYYAGLLAEGHASRGDLRDIEMWRIGAGRHYRFLTAKDQSGVVHATLGTYSFNGVATEIMSGRTPAGTVANLPAQDLLHWEAFRIHRAAGDRWFNLAGFNPTPGDAKEIGIRRFKEKWGGREVAVPQFVRERDPMPIRLARQIFRRSAKI